MDQPRTNVTDNISGNIMAIELTTWSFVYCQG